jgi:hypothetical protein
VPLGAFPNRFKTIPLLGVLGQVFSQYLGHLVQ